jgi:P-type Cu2+ transporter
VRAKRKLYRFNNIKIYCEGCVVPLYSELNEHKDRLKIKKQHINVQQKTLTVWLDKSNALPEQKAREELRRIVEDWLPTETDPIQNFIPPNDEILEILPPSQEIKATPFIPQENHYYWQQAALGSISGAGLMLLMLMNIAIPNWAHFTMIFGGAALTGVLGANSFKNAWEGLRPKGQQNKSSLNMDFLFSLSAIAAIAVSILHLFFPIMPMMIEAALMIFGFRRAGQWLEASFEKNKGNPPKFVDRTRAQRYRDDKKPVIGSFIKVPRGACVPLNGILLSPNADLSFTVHTGKIEPISMKAGDELCAGMEVASEEILMEVTDLEEDSYLAYRDECFELAQAETAPIQQFTQKVMDKFIPALLITAMGVGIIASLFFGPVLGIRAALYLLVCACPCTLGFITSLAVKFGLKKIENQGLTFNTAKGLEAASTVDTVVFDLNGTLTRNEPRVLSWKANPKYLAIIAAMEAQSDHVIAKEILKAVGTPSEKIVFDHIKPSHHGIEVVIGKDVYKIGNSAFTQPSCKVVDTLDANHVIYFTKNGQVRAHFLMKDPLRDDAKTVIQTLLQQKKSLRILTGANRETAKQYAHELGLDHSHFITDCEPEDKEDFIQALRDNGKQVAMFGDSGNDAEAITRANLGVVISSPATDPMSEQTADITLTNTSLMPILQIFAVGKQTMRSIKQNLGISFAYNFLSLGFVALAIFAFPGFLNPAFGAGLMVVQSACVMANAYRIKSQGTGIVFPEQRTLSSEPLGLKTSDQPNAKQHGGFNPLYNSQTQAKTPDTMPSKSDCQRLGQTLV